MLSTVTIIPEDVRTAQVKTDCRIRGRISKRLWRSGRVITGSYREHSALIVPSSIVPSSTEFNKYLHWMEPCKGGFTLDILVPHNVTFLTTKKNNEKSKIHFFRRVVYVLHRSVITEHGHLSSFCVSSVRKIPLCVSKTTFLSEPKRVITLRLYLQLSI